MPRRTSQWTVVSRCIKLITRLQRGSATLDEILRLLYSDDISRENALKRFDYDKRRIREHLGIDIGYDPRSEEYQLYSFGSEGWIDFPDEVINTLQFLRDTFHRGAPDHERVQSMIDHLSETLSINRRRRLNTQSEQESETIRLRKTDDDLSSEEYFQMWERIRKARREHRIIRFLYRSPSQTNENSVEHEVEPWYIYFDSRRGHYYLDGYCLITRSDRGEFSQRRYIQYRPGRIIPSSLKITSRNTAPFPPKKPTYEIIYQLDPQIARYDTSRRFQNSRFERQSDGSMLVYAETDNMFIACRELLFYGPGCTVIGGSVFLKEFKKLLKTTADNYNFD